MKQLFSAMKRNPDINRLTALLTEDKSEILMYGLSGSAKFATIASCYKEFPQTMVIVVHEHALVNEWYDALSSLLPDAEVMVLPERDTFDVSAEASSTERSAQRLNVLAKMYEGEPVIVISDMAAAVQKDVALSDFKHAGITLHVGDSISMDALLSHFVEIGYFRCDEIEYRGNFTARGGIADIFPANSDRPIRIEFFGDEIDSIREFDLVTKRSVNTVGSIQILPLLRGSKKLKKTDPFLSYLKKGTILFDEPARLHEAVHKMLRETPEIKDAVYSWDKLVKEAEKKNVVYCSLMLQQIPGAIPATTISLQAVQMPVFQHQMDLLENDLSRWLEQGQDIFILMPSDEKRKSIHDFLEERKIPSLFLSGDDGYSDKVVNLCIGSLPSGFEMVSAHIVVLTEHDIFGHGKKRTYGRTKSDSGERIMHFRDIKPGDYVVHEAHGIGKYLGVETLEIDGIHRDYLHIKYGGDDKLFVPTDQVGLLQKYIGAEGETPRLHRMGGTEWIKAKTRARKSVEDIAKKLLDIYARRKNAEGYAYPPDDSSQQEFEEAFPYEETEDQLKAIAEIKADMERAKPMDRLLCGDVGFGKTEVAIRAAYKAALSGKQVAVLVPTTVLAQQHYQTFVARFQDFEPRVDVICCFRTPKQQKETLEKVRLGQIDILIGTHALLNQKRVVWKDLGLLIVDEEQRFGVKQKEKIKKLAAGIDVLTLSATPIPRTLHMSLAGARDMSIIETPPSDRFPVQTYVVRNSDDIIVDAIRREMKRGGQIYFVYNRVDTIDRMRQRLESLIPEARIMTAHGQMPEKLLESVMMDFYEGRYDVLLATSIVENGLDIANANTIIVYDADHFGLAQLYQMRGRVGRSHHMAFAYFIYSESKILSETAEKRLQAMKDFAELGAGFKIAMRDLEIRGAGNLLGAEQHGHIASVGFEMYVKLLEEAVEKLKHGDKTVEITPEPVIDMKADAYIDGGYIHDAMHKIEIYQRIASIRSNEEIPALIDELIDRFGEPSEPVMRLLDIARIKNYARALSLRLIKEEPSALEFFLLKDKRLPAKGVLQLDRHFKQRLQMLPEHRGFRIMLSPKMKADIPKTAIHILCSVAEEEAVEKGGALYA